MSIITKVGAVTFTHAENFSGEVEIEKNGLSVKVSFEALQKVVGEKVRRKMIADLEVLKPNEVLALAVSKK